MSERKQWAFAIALGVTLFVALVWASLLVARISNTPITEAPDQTVVATDSPFNTLTQGFREAWNSLRASITSIGSIEYQPEATSSGKNGLR